MVQTHMDWSGSVWPVYYFYQLFKKMVKLLKKKKKRLGLVRVWFSLSWFRHGLIWVIKGYHSLSTSYHGPIRVTMVQARVITDLVRFYHSQVQSGPSLIWLGFRIQSLEFTKYYKNTPIISTNNHSISLSLSFSLSMLHKKEQHRY